ncbi:hypothetical protein [Emticicia sp. BO119]|nr:hypothetical protein [Emticicia sp. BO119]
MKTNLTAVSTPLQTESMPSIRTVLKLIGMKEVATNVFSLPTKTK